MNVDAATSGWIAHISPSQQLAADAATHAQTWGLVLGWAIVVIVSVLVLRSRVLLRIGARARSHWWLNGFVAAGSFCGVLLVAAAPLALIGGQGLASLVVRDVQTWLAAVAAAMIFFAAARASPRRWQVWLAPAAACAAFLWAFAPYALDAGPPRVLAPPGPVTLAVTRLIAHSHVPAGPIGLSPSPGFDADVTGGFGPAKVSVTAEALGSPPAEVAGYVAHLMGHYTHRDILRLALVLAGWAFVGVLATAAAFRPVAAALGAGDLEHPSDPAGLPLVAIILAGVIAVAWPVLAGVSRAVNVRADRYALELSRDPDAYVAALIRTWDHHALAPDPLAEALLYTHPPLPGRIRHAMAWKAGEQGPAVRK